MKYEEVRVPEGGRELRSAARRAATRLRSGGIVVHPTSTLYGLGARATRDLDAELARLKGRPAERPFVRLAPDPEGARSAAGPAGWNDRAERLARRFWPGPLTLVLEDGSPDGLAVRVDSHPVARAVLAELREPMSSTSVNRTGEAPARDPAEVRSALAAMPRTERPVMFLNAGSTTGGTPSTLLSLRGAGPARLLREGAVSAGEVEACLEESVAR